MRAGWTVGVNLAKRNALLLICVLFWKYCQQQGNTWHLACFWPCVGTECTTVTVSLGKVVTGRIVGRWGGCFEWKQTSRLLKLMVFKKRSRVYLGEWQPLLKLNVHRRSERRFKNASQVIPCASPELKQVDPIPKGEDHGPFSPFWELTIDFWMIEFWTSAPFSQRIEVAHIPKVCCLSEFLRCYARHRVKARRADWEPTWSLQSKTNPSVSSLCCGQPENHKAFCIGNWKLSSLLPRLRCEMLPEQVSGIDGSTVSCSVLSEQPLEARMDWH